LVILDTGYWIVDSGVVGLQDQHSEQKGIS
jgi:hypothetical protein